MDLRRVPWALAALLILSSARGLAAPAPTPVPETMDDDDAIVLPDAGGPLRRIDTRVADLTGKQFDIVTWSDAYGRHRVTIEPTVRAPASGTPQEMDGITSPGVPGADGGGDAAGATALTAATPPGRWTSIGPDGGQIVAICVSPLDSKLMLAGAGNTLGVGPLHSIYRSTDGGTSWTPVLTLQNQFGYDRVARQITFGSDGVAYAATGQGIFRSRDGGATWDRQYSGPAMTVAVDPSDARRVWAGFDYYTFGRVMRSLDGGATWTAVNVPAIAQIACRTIAFDPARPGVVHLGFGQYDKGQVWFSSDDGAHWINRSINSTGPVVNRLLRSGNRLWAAVGEWVGTAYISGGLWVSSDDGVSWQNRSAWSTALTTVAGDVAVDPSDSCAIWVANQAGILRSLDCGQTWNIRITRGSSTQAILALPGVVFAGSDADGVLRTGANGLFEVSSRGIRELTIAKVAVNPLNANELAAAAAQLNSGGVYTSTDAGQTWKLESTLRVRISDVEFAPDGRLHAITDGPGFPGFWRRNANGSWINLGPSRNGVPVAMWFDPEQAGVVLVGGTDYSTSISRAAIWRSTNGGLGWELTYSAPYGRITALALVGSGSSRAMLASGYFFSNDGPPGQILRSTDNANTWTNVQSGPFYPNALVVSRQHPDRVYMSSYYGSPGIMRSDDAGRTWATTYAPGVQNVAIHPDDDQVLYAAIGDLGLRPVIRSRDGGRTFQPFNEGASPGVIGDHLLVVGGECPSLLFANTGGVDERVADIERPHVSVRVDPNELWPPNHEMVEVHAQVAASDVCDPHPRWRLASITVDGQEVGGDIGGAAFGTEDLDFSLRAERPGSGPGRTYAITYVAEDESGNTERRTVFVVAPHDQSGRRQGAAEETASSGAVADAVSAPRVVRAGSGLEVRFGLRRADRVRVEVFDLMGARVRVLVDEQRAAGEQALTWDGRNAGGRVVSSGVYLVRLRGSELQWNGKAVVVR